MMLINSTALLLVGRSDGREIYRVTPERQVKMTAADGSSVAIAATQDEVDALLGARDIADAALVLAAMVVRRSV